ncbi:MAG: carbohydrate kinase [Planctomycetes bacterium]|nr:carbohydrate kinase [Planctomycetota bacterium]
MKVICIGEVLVDFCSTVLDKSLIESPGFTKAPGGAPANVAVAIKRLGGDAGFIGTVGDDPFGEFLVKVLKDNNVDTSHLHKLRGRKTPLAFAARYSDGRVDFAFYHDGKITALEENHIDESYIIQADALHFGSICRIDEPSRLATDKARKIAGDNALLISYDPNYRPRLWTDQDFARKCICEGFVGTTVTKVSKDEWAFLLGTEDFHTGAALLLDKGVELVIRSEGGDGASFATKSTAGHVDAFEVNAVEFTGAGDAFVASLLVDLLKIRADSVAINQLDKADIERIITRANAVGALTTTKPGAISAIPTRQEVDKFLSKHAKIR